MSCSRRSVTVGRLSMKTAMFLTAWLAWIETSRSGEPVGFKMAVASFRTGDTEIFIVDPDTGDAFNLTRSPASSERYPSFSPDGRKVSFNSNRDGTHNLFVIDSEKGEPRMCRIASDGSHFEEVGKGIDPAPSTLTTPDGYGD
jgi:WD40-like Beta Propeller Repeat